MMALENNLDLHDQTAVAFVLKKPLTSTNVIYAFIHKKQNFTGKAIPIIQLVGSFTLCFVLQPQLNITLSLYLVEVST